MFRCNICQNQFLLSLIKTLQTSPAASSSLTSCDVISPAGTSRCQTLRVFALRFASQAAKWLRYVKILIRSLYLYLLLCAEEGWEALFPRLRPADFSGLCSAMHPGCCRFHNPLNCCRTSVQWWNWFDLLHQLLHYVDRKVQLVVDGEGRPSSSQLVSVIWWHQTQTGLLIIWFSDHSDY